MQRDCPFCFPESTSILYEDAIIRIIWDAFPVSPGHILVVPKRHVSDWFASSPTEQQALTDALSRARNEILKLHQPDAFNVGINIGAEAGQTIPHLHIHLIPRYRGDVADPRGGVRYVIPQKANYLKEPTAIYEPVPVLPASGAHGDLVSGGTGDPLIARLRADLAVADDLDMAVAFILPSGVTLLENHISDLLAKGGRVRILTGDYQQTTDPFALRKLLDLDSRLVMRVHECGGSSFHPKAYVISSSNGKRTAYVGSSNLTRSGLLDGVEWNYRTEAECDPMGFAAIQEAFELAFKHPQTREITAEWIENYAACRLPTVFVENAVEAEPLPPIPDPHEIQVEALAALAATRAAGNKAGLVVLATGLGKTWLSAFDSKEGGFRRILFVAHREEILEQSLKTFRAIRPEARFGRYTGRERSPNADVLFASVQTLGRVQNLRVFDKDAFDYIVIDEFHHAAASTYRKIIDYFEPKFLLGLTATPERTDGGDLLALCDENLVYTCPVGRGISSGLLSPFHYFGVPDIVDYKNIPWRNSRFDEAELTNALATEARAENALEQLRLRGGSRALGFCCSVRHADFMARFVNARGVCATAVHSGPSSAPRTQSLEKLRDGALDIVFTVDMFNEGVDVPAVDTVLMLRPTESRILWQQQFGRGLRRAEGKERLNVIDYIGNHRAFLLKPQTLFGLGPSDREIYEVLASYRAGTLELPAGCEVTYDLETVDILAGLLRTPRGSEALRQYYRDFVELHDRRPSALEADHDGMNPNSARQEHGSWLGFVKSMGGLSPEQASCIDDHMQFLEDISITPMTKSYKMLLLLAMLNLDGIPGRIEIGELARAFRARASRSKVLSEDVGAALSDDVALRRHLEENPINAWVGGRGTGGRFWFAYDDEYLSTTFEVAPDAREPLQELVREVCDWRLAQYLRGVTEGAREVCHEIVCKVKSPRGGLHLQLPSREGNSVVPYGATVVRVNSEDYVADFEHATLKVLKKNGQAEDCLAPILTGWFGSDAGRPGTDHRVSLRMLEGAWDLRPSQGETQGGGPVLWKSYMRSEIPGLLGFGYVENLWRQGFVRQNNHLFLLVTLHKAGMAAEHQYADKFLDRRTFEWQSQNRQARDLPSGRILRDHKKLGLIPLLFVRAAGKVGSRTLPFHYCGDLEFVSWDGDRPITVRWALKNEMPEALYARLNKEQDEI